MRSMTEDNLLGVSQPYRECYLGPLPFVPGGSRSARVPDAFSVFSHWHKTMCTSTTGQVTTKLLCTRHHGAIRHRPCHPHGTLRSPGTWNPRQEKSNGTTGFRPRRPRPNSRPREATYHQKRQPALKNQRLRKVALEYPNHPARFTTTISMFPSSPEQKDRGVTSQPVTPSMR